MKLNLKKEDNVSILIFLTVVIIDQVSKFLVRSYLYLGQKIQIASLFSISHIENTGAAFGILKEQQLLLSLISIIVFLLVIYFYYIEKSKHIKLSLSVFAGGIFGNFIDRFFLSSVTDFLDFQFWPAFNIADAAITLSVIAIAYFVFIKKEE